MICKRFGLWPRFARQWCSRFYETFPGHGDKDTDSHLDLPVDATIWSDSILWN